MAIENAENLCINCMREKPDGGICPFCGFDESQYEPSPHHLTPRSILGGKYLIGRVLGEGGFGITYIGLDLNLDLKLAIKEYYPTGFVTRTSASTSTVTPLRGEKTEFFTAGRARFINEAKTLARFYTLPGIVSVRDFFQENGTAYIVMEFVEGETLKQRLARVGGKMDTAEVLELMRPLLRSLAEMHASGLIHRDISPDNIMITPENFIKLIDFGAAREYLDSGNRSLSVMLKPGYAPEEQYFSRGQQGPWTDIYALSATIYRAITGVTPQESVERLRHDELQAPSALGARLSPAQDAALLKGLSVSQEERWQSIPEVLAALYSEGSGKFGTIPQAAKQEENPKQQQIKATEQEERSVSEKSSKPDAKKSSPLLPIKLMFAAIGAVALLFVIVIFITSGKSGAKKSIENAATPAASLSPSPAQTAVEDDYQVFPLKRRALVPASEQDALFHKALALLDQGKLAEAMATYDFSQRLSASGTSTSMLTYGNGILESNAHLNFVSSMEALAPAVAVSEDNYSVLRADGTVACLYDNFNDVMLQWSDIVIIRTRFQGTVGLKSDGTIVSTSVLPLILKQWTDLIDISYSINHFVGLKSDGTVVALCFDGYDEDNACAVDTWSDIVMVSTGNYYTAGLKSDGTVITTNPYKYDVSDWHDIISINADDDILAGIDVRGNVHITGFNSKYSDFSPALEWRNIVAVDKSEKYIVGLQADGTVVAYRSKDTYFDEIELIEGKKSW